MSKLIFGCEQLGGMDWGKISMESMNLALNDFYHRGYRDFDTAGIYGLGASEINLSKALGYRIHDCKIHTKGGLYALAGQGERSLIRRDCSKKSIENSVIGSLKRLGIDSIYCYYYHYYDDNTDINEIAETIFKLKSDGLIKNIGISNFNINVLSKLFEIIKIDYIQYEYNLFNKNDLFLSFSKNNNIKYIGYSTLARGILTNLISSESLKNFQNDDRRSRLDSFSKTNLDKSRIKISKLIEYCKKNKLSISAVMLAYYFQTNALYGHIFGVKNISQFQENVSLIEKPISPELMTIIKGL